MECATKELKELRSVEIENRKQLNEVENKTAQIKQQQKQNQDSCVDICNALQNLQGVLEEKNQLLQDFKKEKGLHMKNNKHLNEQITKLKEEIEKRDKIIKKLRNKVKNLEKDIFIENKKTRDEITKSFDEVTGGLELMHFNLNANRLAITQLLTKRRTQSISKTFINIGQVENLQIGTTNEMIIS